MKKSIKLATMLVAGAMMLVSCGGDGSKTTDSGPQPKSPPQTTTAQHTPTAYCRPRRPSTATSTRAC